MLSNISVPEDGDDIFVHETDFFSFTVLFSPCSIIVGCSLVYYREEKNQQHAPTLPRLYFGYVFLSTVDFLSCLTAWYLW